MEEKEIINRVTGSSLIVFNLEDYFPEFEVAEIDLSSILFQGQILREKDVRDFVKHHDWNQYLNKHLALHCSADAIVPTWAFMLIGIAVQPFAASVVFGNRDALMTQLFKNALSGVDWEKYRNEKVVIKGCGDRKVPESAFLEVASRLRPVATSIMYGEPCSTVPLYRKPK